MKAPGHGPEDRGSSAPLSLMLGVGLIVLPVMVLVLTLPTWEQRAVDAEDAAHAAAHALAVADGWDRGTAIADAVVLQAATDNGLAPADVTARYSGSLAPGGEVTAIVTVAVPVGNVPGLGQVGTMYYSASSTEHVDSYRGSAS